MPKRLFLMRHSQAMPFASSDFERKLTEYGNELARNRAMEFKSFLNEKNININYCFYSSAKRTSQTYQIVKDTLNLETISNSKTKALYLTGIKQLKEIFKSYAKEIESKENLLIIAHNFGISDIATDLSGIFFNMREADIVKLEIDINKKWYNLLDFEGSWKILD